MKIITVKETYIIHLIAPKRVQSMLTGLHGIDIITPGTSTVDYVQDYNYCEVCKISDVS